jgi:hypothetical protein
VVEAGCKTVIGARLKRSGMFWSVEGANAPLLPTETIKTRGRAFAKVPFAVAY